MFGCCLLVFVCVCVCMCLPQIGTLIYVDGYI